MSPRRNHPHRGQGRRGQGPGGDSGVLEPERARRGVEGIVEWGGEDWTFRGIPGSAAVKTYRCPGCDHEIAPGVAHIVAWRADGIGGPDDRRHWHTGCWRARAQRTPRVPRSRDAPRYG